MLEIYSEWETAGVRWHVNVFCGFVSHICRWNFNSLKKVCPSLHAICECVHCSESVWGLKLQYSLFCMNLCSWACRKLDAKSMHLSCIWQLFPHYLEAYTHITRSSHTDIFVHKLTPTQIFMSSIAGVKYDLHSHTHAHTHTGGPFF